MRVQKLKHSANILVILYLFTIIRIFISALGKLDVLERGFSKVQCKTSLHDLLGFSL